MVPPHYRPSTTDKECGNCGAYKRKGQSTGGFCRMFNVNVKADMVCDKWYPIKKLKLAGSTVKVW